MLSAHWLHTSPRARWRNSQSDIVGRLMPDQPLLAHELVSFSGSCVQLEFVYSNNSGSLYMSLRAEGQPASMKASRQSTSARLRASSRKMSR